MGRIRVPSEEIEPFAEQLAQAYGAPETVAAHIAESLVAADLRGHRSHGVVRLAMLYREMIDAGDIDPTATPEVVREADATVTIDGHGQFGQAVGRLAVEVVSDRAESHGVAVAGIRNAAHLGRIGEWAERATENGLVFVACVNTGGLAPLVAPPGSADRRLATNPIAAGVPSFGACEFPIVLDMATSQVAHGKITKRSVENESLPEEWVVTPSGESLTDPDAFQNGEGAILPLGGHTSGYKGFGLGVIAELFAGVFGDAFVAGQEVEGSVNNAAFFFAADPDRFGTPEANQARVEALATFLRSANQSDDIPMGPGAREDRALLPGEAEHRTREERETEGIPFAQETLDLLAELAAEKGVADAVPPSFEA
jgi:uncharacterized oxidoreductase